LSEFSGVWTSGDHIGVMRILLLTTTTFSAVGGISRYTAHLCRALGEMPAVSLDVCSLCDSEHEEREPYLSTDSPRIRFRGFDNRRVLYSLWTVCKLLSTSYDVCLVGHAHLLPLIVLTRFSPRRPRLIVMAYGIEVWCRLTRLRRIGLGMCDQVWAISWHTAGRMQAVNGPVKKASILHNALDPFWAAQAELQQAPAATKSLLTVARLTRSERDKGHAQVIRALPEVLAAVPDVHYDVVGGGDLIPELCELAAECGVRERISFHGQVEDARLHQFYRDCSLFVMPSKKEGFGYVYLEAMYYGKPVVAGATDAGSEVVHHNRSGLLVDPDDHGAVAAALIRLLQDDRLRREMGQQGRRLVEQQYTFDLFKKRLAEYLTSATGQE
jgi:glycosyltransferase involved in cell wall biosynthesis